MSRRSRVAQLVLALALAAPVARSAAPPGGLAPGERLPALRGELLSGPRFVVPDSTAGRTVVLFMGFTYESRHDVERWAARFRGEFGGDPRLSFLEVPVIGTAGRLGRPFIDGGMRRKLPRDMHGKVLMVYRDAGLWKRLAGHADPDVGYVMVVGPDGRLAWRGHGPFTDAGWTALAARLRDLAGGTRER